MKTGLNQSKNVFMQQKSTWFPEVHLHTVLSWETASVQLEVKAHWQLRESKRSLLHYATIHVLNNDNSIISLSEQFPALSLLQRSLQTAHTPASLARVTLLSNRGLILSKIFRFLSWSAIDDHYKKYFRKWFCLVGDMAFWSKSPHWEYFGWLILITE